MGHNGYLPQYDRKNLEDKIEMYEELEPELFVYDLTKKDEKIKKLTQANKEIDNLNEAVKELQEFQKFSIQRTLFPEQLSAEQLKKFKEGINQLRETSPTVADMIEKMKSS